MTKWHDCMNAMYHLRAFFKTEALYYLPISFREHLYIEITVYIWLVMLDVCLWMWRCCCQYNVFVSLVHFWCTCQSRSVRVGCSWLFSCHWHLLQWSGSHWLLGRLQAQAAVQVDVSTFVSGCSSHVWRLYCSLFFCENLYIKYAW